MKTIEILFQSKAIELNLNSYFTWTSGIKSPIYIDLRLINSLVEQREFIEKQLVNKIKKQFEGVDLIAGVATAGISHAAYVSHFLKLPMIYVRSEKKLHGKGKQIEGFFFKKQKVVVIEDLFSTGKSSKNAIKVLKEANLDVLGAISIFSYETKKLKSNFKNIKYTSLLTLDELLEHMYKKDELSNEDLRNILEFRDKIG